MIEIKKDLHMEDLSVKELKERLSAKNLPTKGSRAVLIKRLRNETKIPKNVEDPELYLRIRNKVKSSVSAWPSAYASGQVVAQYKQAGGTYSGKKATAASGLQRWFDEKWVDVCSTAKTPKPCGRPATNMTRSQYTRTYPYCRPLVRVNEQTPKTVSELSAAQLRKRCSLKKADPTIRIA